MALALHANRLAATGGSGGHDPMSSGAALPGMPWLCGALRMPFDAMRNQHAHAVRAGFLNRSILESCEFEKRVHALEQFWLGPLARKV